MRILGLSSATKVISFGFIDDDNVLVDKAVDDMRAEMILSYIREAGIKPEEIEGVAAAIGPGSYSGLRGGAATAKTLAQTLEIPLVGVSTLEAIAYNAVGQEKNIAVMLDAKRDEFNFATFKPVAGRLERLTEDQVLREIEIKAKITNDVLLLDGRQTHPLGINVAKIGLALLKSGQTADPLKLVPQYSHLPNIRLFKS
ncbi:MAG: tRNA (adenosine(37)-N6)-threonylcarbamoyltransferase complex dimerization subunit type 1 TsaB [bacterium]